MEKKYLSTDYNESFSAHTQVYFSRMIWWLKLKSMSNQIVVL